MYQFILLDVVVLRCLPVKDINGMAYQQRVVRADQVEVRAESRVLHERNTLAFYFS